MQELQKFIPNFRAKNTIGLIHYGHECSNYLGVDFVLMCNKLKGKVIYEDKWIDL